MAGQRYWAFLSYSSKDSEFVRKLHKKLETYHIPRDLVGRPGRDEPIPRKLFPVFRDRDELPLSSNLGSTIQHALEASRYLIVICSPNSARSQWVNQEILHFKALGRQDRILALILDGEPNATRLSDPPAPECFPEALRFEVNPDGTLSDRPTEPIAGDLRPGKDGWKLAFLKCIAGITGCGLNALTAREKKREQRRRLLQSLAAAAVLVSGAAWWDYSRTKVHYYANLIERFSQPEGYFPISSGDIAERQLSYRIESSRGKIRRITAVHASGSPVEELDHDAATEDLRYDENGQLQEVVFRSRKGRILARRILSALRNQSRIIEYKNEQDDSPMALSADKLAISSGASAVVHSEITAQRAVYHPDGTLAELHHLSSWREPRADPDGVFILRYAYENGSPFPSTITHLDASGQPIRNRKGFAIATFRRSPSGWPLEIRLFDESSRPAIEPSGWHAYVHTRDANDHVLSTAYFDAGMQPAIVVEGYHTTRYTRNGQGDTIERRYFDISGQPVCSIQGHHLEITAYDSHGNPVREEVFDESLQPVINQDRWHRMIRTWDASGTNTSNAYFDSQGQPCAAGPSRTFVEKFEEFPDGTPKSIAFFDGNHQPFAPDSFHRVVFTVNSKGKFDSWSHYDIHNQPVADPHQEFMVRLKHDQRGNIIDYASFSSDGQPCNIDGIHRIHHTFDERGLEILREIFDASGAPTNNFVGIHRTETTYNSQGHPIRKAFFAADGSAVTDKLGVHRYQTRFNSSGQITEEAVFGADDRPTHRSNGVHLVRYVPNYADNPLSTSYFDAEGQPIDSLQGFHRKTVEYDPRGNAVSTRYFHTDGSPALDPDTLAHRVDSEFDSSNRETLTLLFDAEDRPVNGNEGWHRKESQRDRRGNIVLSRYSDARQNPVPHPRGGFEWKSVFDSKNRILSTTVFDAQGKPMRNRDGWHAQTREYLDHPSRDTIRYFDEENQPILHPAFGFHARTITTSASGDETTTSIFDSRLQPLADKDGIHSYRSTYRQQMEIRREFFDVRQQPLIIGQHQRWKKTYDPRNRLSSISYFDDKDQPVNGPDGYHRQTLTYTGRTGEIEYAVFDAQGRPAAERNGFSRWRHVTDSDDRLIEVSWFDASGKPITDENGIHCMTMAYDGQGRVTRRLYYNFERQLTLHPEGNAGYDSEYDASGRESCRTWLGLDLQPIELSGGIARRTSVYDDSGDELERRFFNRHLQPVNGTEGFHLRRSTFDSQDRELSRSFFDTRDQPVEIEGTWHRWQAKYDDHGRLIEKSLYRADSSPGVHLEGHHRISYEYDNKGNQTSISFDGPDLQPILSEGQYHRKRNAYNDRGLEILTAYFGTRDEPVNGPEGYHCLETAWDELDRIVSVTAVDALDQAPSTMNSHRVVVSYHGSSRTVARKEFFDRQGNLLLTKFYDEQGELIEK